MEYLPLIPGLDDGGNSARPIREAFQDILIRSSYSKKVAEYIISCQIDADLSIKQNAEQVLQIYDNVNDEMETIEYAEEEILEQKGKALIRKDYIDTVIYLKETIRLKHCFLYQPLNLFYIDYFNLLQKSDLLPDTIVQFLDYRFNNNIHLCTDCTKTVKKKGELCEKYKSKGRFFEDRDREVIKSREKETRSSRDRITLESSSKLDAQTIKGEKTVAPFAVIPQKVHFHNCEPGKIYKKIVKLLNTSGFTQSLVIKDLPKSHNILVNIDIKSKLASGMSCLATITYKPELYRNIADVVSFRNQQGFVNHVPIIVDRVPPRLITCIFKSNSSRVNRPEPGSQRFSDIRREALNSSIDCGSCLLGDYVYVTLFLRNVGIKAKFFIITEDEWYFENIETISTSLEHSSENLWIYPTFFELDHDGVTEISILFFPTKAEMYLEKFYLMCDNNSFQQFEMLGDGLKFNRNAIKIYVPPRDVDISNEEDYCIFFKNVRMDKAVSLHITVYNESSVVLHCYWKLEHKKITDIHEIDKACIDIVNCPNKLAPYGTTDFKFEINLNTSVLGYYNIFFNFFIADVPIMCLERDVKFTITEKKQTHKNVTQIVDVHITEVEIACSIEVEKPMLMAPSNRSVPKTQVKIPKPEKITFSTHFLNFGILPSRLSVQTPFWVKAKTSEQLKWKIVEVKYNIDAPPHMKVINSENITCNSGEFFCRCQKKKIFYTIKNKCPQSWVSMLLLISINEEMVYEIESLCIVTYEIINYNITINGETENPMVCPMKILYTGVPYILTISVENHSPITGMFYFFKPYGNDIKFVDVKVNPKYATLKPLESKSVELEITGSELGIFENIYIPCFISIGQRYINVRLLCAIDGVHLVIYLPEIKNHYNKIMWPPKVLFDYDDNWMICPCTMEHNSEIEFSNNQSQAQSPKDNNLPISNIILPPGNNTPVASTENFLDDKNMGNSISPPGDSSNEPSKSSTDLNVESLKDELQQQFSNELFLQNHVVEIRQVQTRTPTTLTFYLENIAPVPTSYTVDAINYFTTKTFDKVADRLKLKKTEDIWNDMIINDYGILVEPNIKKAPLPDFGLIAVNLTIFANTWGIYQEEIAVDIDDIPCFTFSLLIEVVGSPIVFPLTQNKTNQVPIIRFGSVPYFHDEVQKEVTMINSSCVPLEIVWHTFLNTSSDKNQNKNKFNTIVDIGSNVFILGGTTLNITEKYYGEENTNLITMTLHETKFEKNSTNFISMTLKPKSFQLQPETTYVRCSFIGRIYLEELYRPTALQHLNQVKMEVLCTLELPILKLDVISKQKKSISIYANEVIFNKDFKEKSKFVFHNLYTCTIKAEISIDDPLEILKIEGGNDKKVYNILASSSLEIFVNCDIDHQKILNIGELVYPKKDTNLSLITDLNIQHIDDDLKIVYIQRKLKVLQKEMQKEEIPIDLYIHFPYITAKPTVVRLDQVYLGNTRKSLVTVFNHTGYMIPFEIYTSLASEMIYVTPHYGTLEKSTGVNKSFVDIFIYFTPSEMKNYQESIRIVTNIPNYFIEIPIKATGSINEKFCVDYKI